MSVEPQSSKEETRRSTSASRIVQRLLNSVVIGLYRLTGGMIGGRMQNMSVLLLTSTGRKSGKQYTTPVLYRPANDRLLVVASNGGSGKLPNWWLNARSGTTVHIEIGRTRQRVRARQADVEERQRFWPLLVADYPGYEKYQQRTAYPIPVVILSPTQGVLPMDMVDNSLSPMQTHFGPVLVMGQSRRAFSTQREAPPKSSAGIFTRLSAT